MRDRTDVAEIRKNPCNVLGGKYANFIHLEDKNERFAMITTEDRIFEDLLRPSFDTVYEFVYRMCDSIECCLRAFYMDARDVSWDNSCVHNVDFILTHAVLHKITSAIRQDVRFFLIRHAANFELIDTAKIFITDWKSEDRPPQRAHNDPTCSSFHSMVYLEFEYSFTCTTQEAPSTHYVCCAIETTGPQLFQFHMATCLPDLRELIHAKYKCNSIILTKRLHHAFDEAEDEYKAM